MTTADIPSPSHTGALHAFAWTAVFIVWHGYWALGGDFGFGDQQSAFPDTTSSLRLGFSVAVGGMFAAGLAVPLAFARGVGPAPAAGRPDVGRRRRARRPRARRPRRRRAPLQRARETGSAG